MIKSFLRNLKVFNDNETEDWNEILINELYPLDNINIFWYSSCGLDNKIFSEFSEKRTNERNLPIVDLFICSDYDSDFLDLKTWYNEFDNKTIYFGDENFIISEIIPLKYFLSEQKMEIKNKYYEKYSSVILENSVPDGPDFYYCTIENDDEYFPVLFTNMENTVLLNEIIIEWKIKLKYFCAVTDGCRKGGAWLCMNNINSRLFFKLLVNLPYCPDYWITDHFRIKNNLIGTPPYLKRGNYFFERQYIIENWGKYNEDKKTAIYSISKNQNFA